MARRCIIFFAASIVVLVSGCDTLRQMRLLEPTRYDMEQISSRVYVSKEIPEGGRRKLLGAYTEGKARVSAFYGGLVTDAIVVGCAEKDCIRSFGGHGDGTAVSKVTPAVLLWTKVFGAGEVAHEWSHLELLIRIGPSGARRTIPNWFHEGLATVVGDIPRHSEAVYQEAVASGFPIPPLCELQTGSQWAEAFEKYPNPKGLNIVYATAGHEVRGWLHRVGRPGLFEFIESVKAGETFDVAYYRIGHESRMRCQPDAQQAIN